MYTLMAGELPFDGKTDEDIIKMILKKTLTYRKKSIFGRFTTPCKDLLRRMLTKKPDARVGAIAALNHPSLEKGVY